jgi:hypothetical protein
MVVAERGTIPTGSGRTKENQENSGIPVET